MRIRATKPEFWQSATIAQLDWDTRLILKALESYVDDNGVGKDSVVIFCTAAFPHDLVSNPEVFAKVSRSLSRLSEANLIVRYNVAGEDLIYVRNWKKLQYIDKPNKGRYPRPDGTLQYREPVDESIGAGQAVKQFSAPDGEPEVREHYANPARNLPEDVPQIQSEEQRNRGTEEQEKDDVPLPPEPPVDDWVAKEAVIDKPPAVIDNPSKPSKRYASQAAKAVVRQELGTDYSDAAVNRIGIQVENLTRQGKPDTRIRDALREWQRRPDCTKPEFIPTVYDDLVKASRVDPGNGRVAASDAAFAAVQALKTNPTTRLELE